jgi:hypothetical protein
MRKTRCSQDAKVQRKELRTNHKQQTYKQQTTNANVFLPCQE